MINVFQPALGEEELAAIRRVFASNWPGKGKVAKEFEAAFARHLGIGPELLRSASCCTEGLFLSMSLLGIGAGDEVVLPSISFVGAGNAVVASGARPIFCDVDPRSLNATAGAIERCLSPRTRAVLILHYGGVPCNMRAIVDCAARHRIKLIEDSACSVASLYQGRACGTFGDVGLWSFDSMKTLVTGDGGMVFCRDSELAQRAASLLYMGLDTSSGISSAAETRWWEFNVGAAGRRGILNDIAAAIGLEQLKKLPAFLERRRQVHETYDRELASLDWLQTPPPLEPGSVSSWYLYWIQTRPDRRDRLAAHLKTAGIYATFRYHPLHRVKFYGVDAPLPAAEKAADETLCLPMHQSLTERDLHQIVDAIRKFEL